MPKKPPLSLVRPSPTPVEPPPTLGAAGTNLWRSIQAEFQISDAGGLALLQEACLAADRAAALAARIDQDGEIIHTKAGPRSHPGIRDELAARSFIVRTLQRLGVTDEPVRSVGRPPDRLGWTGNADE